MADSSTRELAAMVAAGAGFLGLIYFMTFFANNRHNAVDIIGFMGSGFWLALIASIGLVLQMFVPRTEATPTRRVRFALETINQNRSYILILIALILLPHIIGWYTNSSPFPIQRGRSRLDADVYSGIRAGNLRHELQSDVRLYGCHFLWSCHVLWHRRIHNGLAVGTYPHRL
jgi:hypothetical protein